MMSMNGSIVSVDALVEAVLVIQSDEAGGHVPLVLLGIFIVSLNVRLGNKVFSENLEIHLGILVSDRGIWKETKGLMVADSPCNLFIDIGSVEGCADVAMVRLLNRHPCIVQKACKDDIFRKHRFSAHASHFAAYVAPHRISG